MIVYCVEIHVKPENRQDFIDASKENAAATVQEQGNLRFDVNQRADRPDSFMFYEVYRDAAAIDAHKQTSHYAKWRDAVAPWMAEPRNGVKHAPLFPEDEANWETRP
jgi:autoinducer 2-degrading protein